MDVYFKDSGNKFILSFKIQLVFSGFDTILKVALLYKL